MYKDNFKFMGTFMPPKVGACHVNGKNETCVYTNPVSTILGQPNLGISTQTKNNFEVSVEAEKSMGSFGLNFRIKF